MLRIPITLARRPGYEDVPGSFTSPVIDAQLIVRPEVVGEGVNSKPVVVPIRILLDTGADTAWVDERLLTKLGVQSLGVEQATTKTLHDERNHNSYLVGVQLPGLPQPFGMYVTGLPFKDDSRAYEAILGMEFLKLGRLVIDGAGESYFELREE